eukprot:4858646-Amphidinium_carterae.1
MPLSNTSANLYAICTTVLALGFIENQLQMTPIFKICCNNISLDLLPAKGCHKSQDVPKAVKLSKLEWGSAGWRTPHSVLWRRPHRDRSLRIRQLEQPRGMQPPSAQQVTCDLPLGKFTAPPRRQAKTINPPKFAVLSYLHCV